MNNESFRFDTVLSKFTQNVTLVYQVIAAVIFVVSLYFGAQWLRNPFIGGFFEQTMVLNGSDTRESGKHWALYAQGFKIGDQLVSVNGQPVSSAGELERVLRSSTAGQPVSVVMRREENNVVTEMPADITLQSFPIADRIAYFIIPAFLSMVFLVISLWIFGLRRSESAGRAFSIMTTSVALVTGTLFDLYTTHHFPLCGPWRLHFPAAP